MAYASAAGGGDTFTWGPNTILMIKTGATASQTVSAAAVKTAVGTQDGTAAFSNSVVTTSANSEAFLDTRDKFFKNSSGNVTLTYSGVTNMEVVPIQLAVLST